MIPALSCILLWSVRFVTAQNTTSFTDLGVIRYDSGVVSMFSPLPGELAIPSNEGKGHPELDGDAMGREDATTKCLHVSIRLGHNVFGVYGQQCHSMVATVPGGAYARFGPLGMATRNMPIYQVSPFVFAQKTSYVNMGCFNDNSTNRALISNEGRGYPELTGTASTRVNATGKCFAVANRLKHAIFAVQNGSCYSSATLSPSSFSRYGRTYCPTSGIGADLINNVFLLNATTGILSRGCWNEGPTNGFEAVRFIANISRTLPDPISYCAGLALSRVGLNVSIFALQPVPGNTSVLKCSAQRDLIVNGSYTTYGAASTCPSSGVGAIGVNHVYQFKGSSRLEFQWDKLDYRPVGCYRAPPMNRSSFRDASRTIEECYWRARNRRHPVFFMNAFGCRTGYDFVPGGNYARLGPVTFCRYDGIGDTLTSMDTHQVYVINSFRPKALKLWDLPGISNPNRTRLPFSSLGCFAYELRILETHFSNRFTSPNETDIKCYEQALKMKHNLFGVYSNQLCVTSLDVIPGGNYSSKIPADCPSHEVPTNDNPKRSSMQIFRIHGAPPTPDGFTKSSKWYHLGCYNRPLSAQEQFLTINEKKFTILDGNHVTRVDAIRKCYEVAKLQNHAYFGILSRGYCVSTSNLPAITSGGRNTVITFAEQDGQIGLQLNTPACLNDLRGSSTGLFTGVVAWNVFQVRS